MQQEYRIFVVEGFEEGILGKPLEPGQFSPTNLSSYDLEEARGQLEWISVHHFEELRKAAEEEDLDKSNWEHVAYKKAQSRKFAIFVREVTPWERLEDVSQIATSVDD